MGHHLRRILVPLTILALLAAALVAPAAAEGDTDDDRADATNGALEVKVRPSIAQVGAPVHVKAELDLDGDDDADEQDDAEDADEESDADDGEGDHDQDADDHEGDENADDHDGEDDADEGDSSVNAQSVDDNADGELPDEAADSDGWTFHADYGDGSQPETMTAFAGHGGSDVKARAMHSYDEAGEYALTVTATHDDGETIEVSVVVQVGEGDGRLAREDRFATAVRISEEAFPEDGSAEAVLLARGDQFADALAASSLALMQDASVLLTRGDLIPDGVLAEIARVLAEDGTIFVFGGEAAISADVVTTLTDLGYSVERIAGADRVETSIEIARFVMDHGIEIDRAVVAGAADFPDAMAAAPFAALHTTPVLLTARTGLDERLASFLVDELGTDTDVLVVGGAAVVGDPVIAALEELGFDVERIAGADRYETAAALAEVLFPDAEAVVLATGDSFPDALAGAAYAARMQAPVLLVGDELPEAARAYLAERDVTVRATVVLGGASAVPDEVSSAAAEAAGRGANTNRP